MLYRSAIVCYIITVPGEALITYCTNIDQISVMYFIEPVQCGCGSHIVVVTTTEDVYVDLQGDKWRP